MELPVETLRGEEDSERKLSWCSSVSSPVACFLEDFLEKRPFIWQRKIERFKKGKAGSHRFPHLTSQVPVGSGFGALLFAAVLWWNALNEATTVKLRGQKKKAKPVQLHLRVIGKENPR